MSLLNDSKGESQVRYSELKVMHLMDDIRNADLPKEQLAELLSNVEDLLKEELLKEYLSKYKWCSSYTADSSYS